MSPKIETQKELTAEISKLALFKVPRAGTEPGARVQFTGGAPRGDFGSWRNSDGGREGVTICNGLRRIAIDYKQVDKRLTKISVPLPETIRIWYGYNHRLTFRQGGRKGQIGNTATVRRWQGSYFQTT